MAGSLYLVATVHAAPGQIDNLLKHIKGIRDYALSNEKGTLTYIVTQSVDDKDSVVIWEEYTSSATHEEHTNGELFKAFLAESSTLLDRELNVTILSGV
ncbi:hypothetical protein BCR39DRAFT_526866 [Naematelia encephala]|uniref:ABM domain-containing protein n=1 Tax=Naematelia encephala TaxID=71784 RepID=A0A1Y2B9Q2_9TREE|nr:hypothetical protein BCR39DRAFT_526866 [Naematelia encephala]